MEWFVIQFFSIYAAVGVATLLVWWIVYEMLLTRGHSTRTALFGRRPNAAVALDLLGGFLAAGILIYAIIAQAPMSSFRLRIPAVVATIAMTLALLAILRVLLSMLIRGWFQGRRDAQGDLVTMNNELFRQHNLATGLFSTVMYLILAGGLVQLDLWDMAGTRIEGFLNMAGIWLMGAALVVIHSFLYLGYGTRNNILHECFHDNNPAAATSLLGLTAGMLLLSNTFLELFKPGGHMFNTPEIWYFLGGILLLVLVIRGVLQLILYLAIKINLRYELVIHDNVAWGIVDGGLIFALFLIPLALLN